MSENETQRATVWPASICRTLPADTTGATFGTATDTVRETQPARAPPSVTHTVTVYVPEDFTPSESDVLLLATSD